VTIDVNSLVRKGETETVELKENFDKEAIQTAGSLANTAGGYIIIGVRKNGTIKGTRTTEETLKDWANQISNTSEPTLIPDIEAMQIGKKTVVVITIKEYPLKPVAIKGRCYRRVGPSNRKMTPTEIADMSYQTRGASWDAMPHPEATMDDVDMERFGEYLSRAVETGRRDFRDDADKILEKLDLGKDERPKWGTIIAFGKRPPMQAKVKCGKIRGTSTIVDDYVVDAPLLDQVDGVMGYMKRVFQLSYVITGKARRDEIWEYPLEAVREVVTNAICHRDYSHPAEIQIKIFDDRLVVWNPGPLPFEMTVEKLMDPAHRSIPRNRLIAMLFYDVGLIERYGSGIQRVLVECERLGFPVPEFSNDTGGFQVIFHKDIYNEEYLKELGLNDRQVKAVLYVKERGKITNSEYQDVARTSERTALRDLKDLCDRSLLERLGETGRGTEYVLTRHKPAKPASDGR